MASDILKFRLGERCSVRSSKRVFAKEYVEVGIPFFRSKDVIDKALGVFQGYDLFISERRYRELKKGHGSPSKGDILISSVGNRSGQSYVVGNEGDFYFKDGNIIWLSDFKDLDPLCLSYWLKSELGQHALSSVMIGSAQKALTIEALRNLPIQLPGYKDQCAIGAILRSLDDKIELNRRMNATLEAMARALFKAWFVDFEPVHANLENRPSTSASPEISKLFPSEFENDVPKGWREGTIADIAKISKDSVSPNKFPDEEFHHFSIPAFDDGKHPKKEPGSTILSNKFLVQRNSVLVSKLNPRIFRAWTVFPPKDGRCIASTEFIVYEARQEGHWSFVNSLVRSDEIISSFRQHVTGTSGSHQRVKPESTLSIPIVIPSEQVLETFNEAIAPIYSLAQVNTDETRSLSQIRDSLLPRLISGRIAVEAQNHAAKD